MIEAFEDAAAGCGADLVATRPVQAERQTVEQDHRHADPLKPRVDSCQGVLEQVQQELKDKPLSVDDRGQTDRVIILVNPNPNP